ncbi:hypothetical protein ACO0LO_26985 [Undibacterium sp. TJN25]|uniref:hypothetical protein n=1 Tax=Undibacterium sp. TJN25 TaxID=3413056 RepID=UPI003BEFCA5D
MKTIIAALLIAAGFVSGACAAQDSLGLTASMSERERVDYLLKQNQMLMEENTRLRSQSDQPKTKEEAFAICMQAAKGEKSAMAAESVGAHCDQLLKR